MQRVYLDNAATTCLHKEVVDAMASVLQNTFGNPSSIHASGREARALIELSRKTIAKQLGAKPAEIIFTSGGTEANNMILTSAVRDLGVTSIITSPIEHHAVLHTVEALHKNYGVSLKFVELEATGTPDYEHLEQLLSSSNEKTLVSLMHVNNEVGTLVDLEKVAFLCEKYQALFHSDTVQSIGHYAINLEKIPIHFLVAAAHKFHGPKGIGFAFVRKNSGLGSFILGGAQERGLRAGTEAVHNIVGMEKAFSLAYSNLEKDRAQILELKKYTQSQLEDKLEGVVFNACCTNAEKSTYTVLNFRIPMSAEKAQLLSFQLDLQGIECSRGSACQAGSESGSHVLQFLNPAVDQPSLRVSFSKYNTTSDVDRLVDFLANYQKD